MSNNQKDVELRIRARDYSQKTLKDLAKTTENLTQLQKQQAKAAELGVGKMKDLEAVYGRLEDAGRAMLRLDSLVNLFNRQTKALEDQSAAVQAAQKRYADLKASLEGVEKITKRQESSLRAAERAVTSAINKEQQRRDAIAKTTSELERYGIDANKAADAQAKLAAGVNKVNAALAAQDKAMSALPMAQDASKLRQQVEAQRIAAQGQADKIVADAQARAAAERAAAQKVIDALEAQARQAVATAKGYQTLGRVVRDQSRDVTQLGQTIFGIISPAEAARQTLAGVEKQVADLASEISSGSKQIKDGASKLRDLAAAQKALLSTAQGIDGFRAQIAAVREARTAYQAAKTELKTLAAQTSATGVNAQEMGEKIRQAQAKVNAASESLRRASAAARETQANLQRAGVNTAQLAREEARLVTTANQATSAASQLSAALRRQSEDSKKAGGALASLADNGRQSLGVFERMRGEIMALVTAYVGVQATLNLAGGAVDAYKARQQALIKISTVVGDSQESLRAEWEYMVGLANKLGINIADLATSYTKFAVAAKAVGIGMDETKFIFENIAKAGRVFGLSADDMNGVFRALEQMLSKGQVYAEELRQQLGERLPGAVAMFAKGMGMTIQELTKAMENGEIKAEAVVNFARAQGEAVQAQLDAANKSVGAAEERLKTAMFLFKLAIADSGFIDAYARALERITAFLNSPDGKEAAQTMGEAFSALAEAVIWCVDNVDLLVDAIQALALLKLGSIIIGLGLKVKVFIGLIAELTGLFVTGRAKVLLFSESLIAVGGAAGAAGLGIRGLARLIPWLGGLLIAWDIGKLMYDQSETFRNAVDACGLYLKGFGNLAITVLGSFFTGIDDMVRLLFRTIHQVAADANKAVWEAVESMLRAIPAVGDKLGDFVKGMGDTIQGPEGEFVSKTMEMWDDLGKHWKQMQEEQTAKLAEEAAKRKRIETGGPSPISGPAAAAVNGTPAGFDFTADPGTGVTPRERQIQALTKAMEKAEIQAKKTDVASQKALMRKNLPGRLALIDQEFAEQMKQAKAIGGPEGDALVKRLQAIIDLRKKAETQSYTAQTQQSGINAEQRRLKAVEALRQEYERLYAVTGKQEAKIDPNAAFSERLAAQLKVVEVQYDALIAKANKLGGAEGNRLAKQFEDLKKVNMELETQKLRYAELDRLQDAANTAVNIKRAGLEEINALREAGLISEDEQVRRVNELYAAQNAQIAKAIENLRQYAMTMKDSMTPEQLALINAEIAKMQAGLQQVSGTYTKMDSLIVNGVLDGMISGIDGVAQGLAGIIDGSMSLGDAFSNLGDIVRQFFADFLAQIAKAILQQMILNALASLGGPIGGAATAAGGAVAGVAHSGAVIGSGSMNRTRSTPASWFAAAPRMHTGGVVGLAPDEVPTVLQKGEEVLAKNDPRNVMNGGAAQPGQPSAAGTTIINAIDADDITQTVMSNPATGSAIINYIRSNKRQVKQILGVG